MLFYDVAEFCCLTEKTAVPGSVLSNHCWINQLPTWILEHLEDCLPRPNPRWLLQHTALLPRCAPVDTLILMPPVFLQGLLKGDRSFSLWSHVGRAGRNSYTFGRTIDQHDPIFQCLTSELLIVGDRLPLELNQRDEFQHSSFNFESMSDLRIFLNHFRTLLKKQISEDNDPGGWRAWCQKGVDRVGGCQEYLDCSSLHISSLQKTKQGFLMAVRCWLHFSVAWHCA